MNLIEDLGRIYPTDNSKQKQRYGIFECPICKNGIKTSFNNVKNGHTTSCRSCHISKIRKTHGDRVNNSRLYRIWCNVKSRCYNKNNDAYKNYGANGITICDEWLNNYVSFKEWALKNGYKDSLEIDKDIICEREKIFPKIYSPNTCLWVTKSENSIEANKRRVR